MRASRRQTRRCEKCLGEFWLNELERVGLRWYCRQCRRDNKAILEPMNNRLEEKK